ncbi:MAG TPA: cupredoxin domain-containing protein [Candidatus Limnocylindria bacterium]|nr:cupredoxin domain-containing protein [Candidatus Limnocylindria bacterium]
MKPIRFSLIALALVMTLAACGSTSADGGSTVDPADADATVTAADMAFAPGTVTVASAGEAFSVALVNEDSMPHNIAIYTDSSKSEKLFEGEMVTGGTIVYDIPALEAGEYFFECSLHPNMTGTLIIEG